MIVSKGIHFTNTSARSYVTVILPSFSCNAIPAKGQIWEVIGSPKLVQQETGKYSVTNIRFTPPDSAKMVMPETAEEFKDFIIKEPKFEGIGIVAAGKLFNEFGLELLKMLELGDLSKVESHPDFRKFAVPLKNGYRQFENLKYAAYFAELKVPPSTQQKLFKFHNVDTVAQINNNPYILQIFGMGFNAVDEIAKRCFNVLDDDVRRLSAIVENVLNEHCSHGHTYANLNVLYNKLRSQIGNHSLVIDALIKTKKNLGFFYNKQSKSVHPTPLFIMESTIAKRINNLLRFDRSDNDETRCAIDHSLQQNPFKLAPKQIEGVYNAVLNNISVIVGGAGTGKTTVLKTITRTYFSLGYNIYSMAVSGRAAKRLRESIGFNTMTIYKFLSNNNLDSSQPNIIVIDESSMLDILSLFSIITSVPANTKFLFVGDSAQLPPIGKGLVLSELVDCGAVPVTELDIVQRQDETTGIPAYTKSIREQAIPVSLSYKDIQFVEIDTRSIADRCLESFSEGTQVLCATRKMAHRINQICQAKLNNSEEIIVSGERTGIRVNDPIIFTKNDYNLDVQNGTLGFVLSQDSNAIQIKVDDGRVIQIPAADDIMLSYAITLHKAQGSQFDTAIIALENSRLVDNSWIYTAITRAVKQVKIYGIKQKFISAIQTNSAIHKRDVFLADLIREKA